MQVYNIKNNNLCFGTYLGVNIQDKLLLSKKHNLLSSMQQNNIAKIEDDGLDVVLDLSDRYIIRQTKGNPKGTFKVIKSLTLSDGVKKIHLDDLSHILSPFSKDKNIFHINKLIKIFNDGYDLKGKIQAGYKLLKSV